MHFTKDSWWCQTYGKKTTSLFNNNFLNSLPFLPFKALKPNNLKVVFRCDEHLFKWVYLSLRWFVPWSTHHTMPCLTKLLKFTISCSQKSFVERPHELHMLPLLVFTWLCNTCLVNIKFEYGKHSAIAGGRLLKLSYGSANRRTDRDFWTLLNTASRTPAAILSLWCGNNPILKNSLKHTFYFVFTEPTTAVYLRRTVSHLAS